MIHLKPLIPEHIFLAAIRQNWHSIVDRVIVPEDVGVWPVACEFYIPYPDDPPERRFICRSCHLTTHKFSYHKSFVYEHINEPSLLFIQHIKYDITGFLVSKDAVVVTDIHDRVISNQHWFDTSVQSIHVGDHDITT